MYLVENSMAIGFGSTWSWIAETELSHLDAFIFWPNDHEDSLGTAAKKDEFVWSVSANVYKDIEDLLLSGSSEMFVLLFSRTFTQSRLRRSDEREWKYFSAIQSYIIVLCYTWIHFFFHFPRFIFAYLLPLLLRQIELMSADILCIPDDSVRVISILFESFYFLLWMSS